MGMATVAEPTETRTARAMRKATTTMGRGVAATALPMTPFSGS